MVASSSPTALKRWIAIELHRLREAAGFERPDAAKRLGKAVTAVGHYETGRNLPTPADLEVLLNFYGVPERVAFFRELLGHAKRGQDWWIHFPSTTVAEWFSLYLGLESVAALISAYSALLVPGLFQTEDYAEAIIRAGGRPVTDDEIERRVKLRMARQEILTRTESPAPTICWVLDESVLRRPVGGRAVMLGQLERLIEVAQLPNVELLVLPAAVGAHAGVEGTFTILDYPEEFAPDPGTVYTENRIEGRYYELPHEVEDFRGVFDSLRALARQHDAVAMISQLAKEFRA